MAATEPGRNDRCPCGSGRKFKHCCLAARSAEDSARLRLRGAEGRVVEGLLDYVHDTWGETLIGHAWQDFWNYQDVPEDMADTPEFESMFVPWLVLQFVPDANAADADEYWPSQPIGLEWLETTEDEVSDLDRAYIETACRSPMSAFVVEGVVQGRSLDLEDVLTGARFHVLEQGASRTLQPGDLIFSRVLTVDGVSVTFGVAPFAVPPQWQARLSGWREHRVGERLMTREELLYFDGELRDEYIEITAGLFDPAPGPINSDGDLLTLTKLTYELTLAPEEAIERLASLAGQRGRNALEEVTRDESGAVTAATLTWIKVGNRHHDRTTTALGTLRIEPGRLVADVNSAPRASRLVGEIAERLGRAAVLVDTAIIESVTVDPKGPSLLGAGGLEDEAAPGPPAGPLETDEEALRQHWAGWLDTPAPALNYQTPRQAAWGPSGREWLKALVDEFERGADDSSSGLPTHLALIRSALATNGPGD